MENAPLQRRKVERRLPDADEGPARDGPRLGKSGVVETSEDAAVAVAMRGNRLEQPGNGRLPVFLALDRRRPLAVRHGKHLVPVADDGLQVRRTAFGHLCRGIGIDEGNLFHCASKLRISGFSQK